MKTNFLYKTSPWIAFLALIISACAPKLDKEFTPSKGSADFTKYVAVGNSLTAGFADGGLYLEGQQNSYPSMLAGQFKIVGGGDFQQPLFDATQANGSGYLQLKGFYPNGSPILQPTTTMLAIRGTTTPNPLLNPMGVLYTKYTNPISNYGVPGIRLSDIMDGNYASSNPFYERILTDAEIGANKTYLQKIVESQPTFFTCWLGNNDALQFAGSGGVVPLTPTDAFNQLYTGVITALTQNAAKGVVATIPDITTIPLFTTVPPSLKKILTANGIPGLVVQSGHGLTKKGVDVTIIVVPTSTLFDGTSGKVLLPLTAAAYLPLIGQQTGKYWNDFAKSNGIPRAVVYGAYGIDTTKMFGLDPSNPFPTGLILDGTEIDNVTASVNSYNATIKSVAAAKGLAFVDFFQILKNYQTPQVINGATYSSAFISGNLFSLDGVHLTPAGYAIVANEYIKAINTTYQSNIPLVSVSQYRGVKFP